MIGKTIVAVDWDWEWSNEARAYLDDGTSISGSDWGLHHHSYADTKKHQHELQGQRERARVPLPPKPPVDPNTLTGFSKAIALEMQGLHNLMRSDYNHMLHLDSDRPTDPWWRSEIITLPNNTNKKTKARRN